MIMDLTTLLSDKQPITATAASTNVIDLGATGTVYGSGASTSRDVGRATDVPLYVGATQSFNNLTSLSISVQVSVDAAFTSPVTVSTSPAYTLAQLQTGAKFLLPESLPTGTNLRYLRLYYTLVGTAPTLGQITAGVTLARQTN